MVCPGASTEQDQELQQLRTQLEAERRRNAALEHELRLAKQQTLAVQQQVEQEEEFITNHLFKRLEHLQEEKQNLATEVERQESYLVNTLQKRLESAAAEKCGLEGQLQELGSEKEGLRLRLHRSAQEKAALENELEYEQEYIVNKLQKKLAELTQEKKALSREKVDLEAQLEREQEYIVNKLRKQVDRLGREKGELSREKGELQKQVTDLAGSVQCLQRDKVALENALEAEEEHIVNRLQRQLEHVTCNFKVLEAKLEALGVPLRDAGVSPMDDSTEWVYGRSPSKNSIERYGSFRRERTLSTSSYSSVTSSRDLARPSLDSAMGLPKAKAPAAQPAALAYP